MIKVTISVDCEKALDLYEWLFEVTADEIVIQHAPWKGALTQKICQTRYNVTAAMWRTGTRLATFEDHIFRFSKETTAMKCKLRFGG